MMKNLLRLSICILAVACSHRSVEVTAPKTSAPKEARCNEYIDVAAPKGFADFDVNKDGKIERDEYLCLTVKRFTAMDKDRDLKLSPAEMKKAGAWKKSGDRNGDGSMSLMEYMQQTEKSFKAADKDGDSAISGMESGKALP